MRGETAVETYIRLTRCDAETIVRLTEIAIRRGAAGEVLDILARAQNKAYVAMRRKLVVPSMADALAWGAQFEAMAHQESQPAKSSPRKLNPRIGENLRQAEIRWQEQADPQIRDAVASGESRRSISVRFGISTTAILNALRRQAKRDGQTMPFASLRLQPGDTCE